MAKFDLQRVKNGDKVRTVQRKCVLSNVKVYGNIPIPMLAAKFSPDAEMVTAIVDDKTYYWWDQNGKLLNSASQENELDLEMATHKERRWLIISNFPTCGNNLEISMCNRKLYLTEAEALKQIEENKLLVIEDEFEEGCGHKEVCFPIDIEWE